MNMNMNMKVLIIPADKNFKNDVFDFYWLYEHPSYTFFSNISFVKL